jgi:hypothetical protein
MTSKEFDAWRANGIIGARLRWSKKQLSLAAQKGATARITTYTPNSPPSMGWLVHVVWDRNGLDGGMADGYYHITYFEVDPGQARKVACSCAVSTLAQWGCRYLQRADGNGYLHV